MISYKYTYVNKGGKKTPVLCLKDTKDECKLYLSKAQINVIIRMYKLWPEFFNNKGNESDSRCKVEFICT